MSGAQVDRYSLPGKVKSRFEVQCHQVDSRSRRMAHGFRTRICINLFAMDALLQTPREYTYPLIPWLFVLIGIKGVCQFTAWRIRNSDNSNQHNPSDVQNLDSDSGDCAR